MARQVIETLCVTNAARKRITAKNVKKLRRSISFPWDHIQRSDFPN
jgi:hypothetical protein